MLSTLLSAQMNEARQCLETNDNRRLCELANECANDKPTPYRLYKFFKKANGYNAYKKKLTVVTINYNNLLGLKKTVESVLQQKKRQEFEFVVIDGNSNDDSLEFLKTAANSIDICTFGQDRGIYHAMNRGLSLAHGDYIIFMNSGDCFESTETISNFLEASEHSDADAFYGSTKYYNGNIWHPHDIQDMWKGMFCCHQSIFIKTGLVEKYKFNEKKSIVADFEQMYKIFLSGAKFKKLDFIVSIPDEAGISGDFYKRTIERWQAVRELENPDVSQSIIDNFYASFMTTRGEWAGAHAFEGDEAFSALDTNVEKRMIFLIAMPRSGTTLLQKILEQSPQIGSAGEPWLMLPLLSMYDDEYIEAKYGQHLNIIAKDEFSSAIADSQVIAKAQKNYARTVYTQALRHSGTRYFLDKTPRYVYIADKLAEIFPKAKFIVLLRNPASVVSSYSTTWFNNEYDKLLDDKYCRYDFEHGFEKLAQFRNSSFGNKIVVRYENLVQNPEQEVKKIFSYLGAPYSQEFIEYNRGEKPTTKYRMGDPSSVYEKKRPDASGADKWATKIPDSERNRFLNIMDGIGEETIKRLGYDKGDIQSKIPKEAILENFLEQFVNVHGTPTTATQQQNQNDPSQASYEERSLGVLITCHNNQDSIELCLRSVFEQSKKPDLVLIADDASSDGSINIVERITQEYPNIKTRIIKRLSNVGVSKNRDLAIRNMEVDYLTTLDGDDYFYPGKLEVEFSALAGREDRIAFSDILVWTKDTMVIQNTSAYSACQTEEMLDMLTSRRQPVPRDMMFPKALYLAAEGFDHGISLYEDWALKMRLMALAGDGNWIHSGGIGTIYDRRNPGLSGRPPLDHAYGQAVVMGRNSEIFLRYPSIISGGLSTVAKPLVNENQFSQLFQNGEYRPITDNHDDIARGLAVLYRDYKLNNQPEKRVALGRLLGIKNKEKIECGI